VGTLTVGHLVAGLGGQGISIRRDGQAPKFVPHVEQVSFSAAFARQRARSVTYVTERAVFALTDAGPMLTEVAPGVDLEREVLARMAFRPAISGELRRMDSRLFLPETLGLALSEKSGAPR
jgi:propionate CoA-transferase